MNEEIRNEKKDSLHFKFQPEIMSLGILKRWKILLVFFSVACLTAIVIGKYAVEKVYNAQTVLVYKPMPEFDSSQSINSRYSLLGLVKIEDNIAEVRKRLKLKATITQIASSIDVFVPNKTSLMFIKVKWRSAKESAEIANTTCDIFMDKQIKIRKEKTEQEFNDLTKRLGIVNTKLKEAEQTLQNFTVKNKVVDLSQEAQWLLEQLTSVELLYEQTKMERQTIDLQSENLEKIIEDLKIRVAQEKSQTSANMESISTLKARAERLNEKITDDKDFRANSALLVEKEVDMERKKTLSQKGYISHSEYDEALAEYKEQKALTIDSEQIKRWRAELSKVDESLVPEGNNSITSLGRLMHDLMLRSFNIQLQKVSLGAKVKSYENVLNNINLKLARLPEIQRAFASLTREVTLRESEKANLETILGKIKRMLKSENSEFSIVSKAKVPIYPRTKHRKIIILLIVFWGTFAGLLFVITLELLDDSIKNRKDFLVKLNESILGVLPKINSEFLGYPEKKIYEHNILDDENSSYLELFRKMIRHIRIAIPKKGARLLVTSLTTGEGKTFVTTNLAACFGRQDERVLLIDGQVRKDKQDESKKDKLLLSDWAIKEAYPLLGLGDYLSFVTNDIDEFKLPTVIPGVECLPCFDEAIVPDLLESPRMNNLLKEASKKFSIILVDSQAIDNSGDALALSKWMDGVILVIETQKCSAKKIREAIDELKSYNIPYIGIILNKIQKPY